MAMLTQGGGGATYMQHSRCGRYTGLSDGDQEARVLVIDRQERW